jgi:hypothetical protein
MRLKLVTSLGLVSMFGMLAPAAATPAPGSQGFNQSGLLQKADYRCYYRYGRRHCRYVSYYNDYDYGYGPGIVLGFGRFGHGFHGHGGHFGGHRH